MFQTKVAEKIKTHLICSITYFFLQENRAVYEMYNYMVRGRQNTGGHITRRMRVACWLAKATDTPLERVM
jgi:hypothetical protein